MNVEAIGAIAAATVAVISALGAVAVKILHEIRESRTGSQLRHEVTQQRLTTIEGAAAGAQAEAGTANARIVELESQLAEARAKE